MKSFSAFFQKWSFGRVPLHVFCEVYTCTDRRCGVESNNNLQIKDFLKIGSRVVPRVRGGTYRDHQWLAFQNSIFGYSDFVFSAQDRKQTRQFVTRLIDFFKLVTILYIEETVIHQSLLVPHHVRRPAAAKPVVGFP